MNKQEVTFAGLIVALSGIGLWVARDTIAPYSGLVAAWVAIVLVVATAMYVRQVSLQVKLARETVEEMCRQRETTYRPALLLQSNRTVERDGHIQSVEIVLANQAAAAAVGVELSAHHPYLNYGPPLLVFAVGPYGRETRILEIEQQSGVSSGIGGMALDSGDEVLVIANYQGIDGSQWHSSCRFTWIRGVGTGFRDLRAGLPGRHIGQYVTG